MNISDFRTRFPEFSDDTIYTDTRINLFASDAELIVNAKCPFYDLSIQYLTAHFLTASLATDSGNDGTIKSTASESVGDVSVSYNATEGSNAYYSTAYGQKYLDLRKYCIGSPVIG